ncbi:hypothetical protein K502DRAFT_350067 [Neoconidiobolus thromboides FSU 785]|nr:hypothetical protein K502DRAFT_350067 [Neoconidiobolus thromboides FSU 785]
MESKINKALLKQEFPCREKEIDILSNIDRCPIVDFIYIWGSSNGGKTTLLKKIYAQKNLVYIDLIECYSLSLVLNRILYLLFKKKESCSKLSLFLSHLKCLDSGKVYYLILDNAERLHSLPAQLLSCLLKIKEKINIDFKVILISNLPYSKLRLSIGIREPFQLNFKNYNVEEMKKILLKKAEAMEKKEKREAIINLFQKKEYLSLKVNFLDLFLKAIFIKKSTHIPFLIHLFYHYLLIYSIPVITSQSTESFQPSFLYGVFAKNGYADAMVELKFINIDDEEQNNQTQVVQSELEANNNPIILPYYAKYLLIASYLASYNPAKLDPIYFYNGTNRILNGNLLNKNKRERKNKDNDPKEPSFFPMDRLMAIFYSILTEELIDTSQIDNLLATLISNQFISQVGGYGRLEDIKLKCEVSFELIKTLSDQVNLDLRHYLHASD